MKYHMIEVARVALTTYGVAVIAFDVLVVRVLTLSVARAVCGCCCCRFSYGWLLNSTSSDAATAAVRGASHLDVIRVPCWI